MMAALPDMRFGLGAEKLLGLGYEKIPLLTSTDLWGIALQVRVGGSIGGF